MEKTRYHNGDKSVIFIGIDPGSSSGAIAILDDGRLVVSTKIRHSPIGDTDYKWLNELVSSYKPNLSCIEFVHSMPGQGVSSTFKFGKAYGTQLAILGIHSEELLIANPSTWKTVLLARNGYEKDKKGSVAFVASRFPGTRIRNHNVADAVCLALYAMHIKELRE